MQLRLVARCRLEIVSGKLVTHSLECMDDFDGEPCVVSLQCAGGRVVYPLSEQIFGIRQVTQSSHRIG